jgi:hypothetical protein
MQIWNHTKLNKVLMKIIIIVYKITKSNQKLLNNFRINKENLKSKIIIYRPAIIMIWKQDTVCLNLIYFNLNSELFTSFYNFILKFFLINFFLK